MAIVYSVVILILSKDYSSSNLIKVSIQGVIFAMVYSGALWLLDKYRNDKNK